MRIHLSRFDVISLREQAERSSELTDEGELFAEEAIASLSEGELHAIEERSEQTAEDFFMGVFEAWSGREPEAIIPLMIDHLAEIDIELTFEEPGEDEDFEDEAWGDEELDDVDDYDDF